MHKVPGNKPWAKPIYGEDHHKVPWATLCDVASIRQVLVLACNYFLIQINNVETWSSLS